MAFSCELCRRALTELPDLRNIPNAWVRHMDNDEYANPVFSPNCGHVFHLGCINECLIEQEKEPAAGPTECPVCGSPCEMTGLRRMYPVIQQPEIEELEKPEEEPEEEINSYLHSIFAFAWFAFVVQCCFYKIRNSDHSEIEDEEIEDPRWILKFWANLAMGMLLTSVPVYLLDCFEP